MRLAEWSHVGDNLELWLLGFPLLLLRSCNFDEDIQPLIQLYGVLNFVDNIEVVDCERF